MMKLFVGVLGVMLVIFPSCNEATSTNEETSAKMVTKNVKPGYYQEFYDNGQVKVEGKKNKAGLKEGLWMSFFENGNKMSESNFKNGLNDGYSMVWQPNALVHYFGNYKAGKKIGEWTFYDKNGKVSKVENY
ncbi:hypothetical protein DNU06_03265 [Putridiphycobacter roseus]|uniref:Toxin-antitoxin system YwqK family antitoxin n=1 Tax=Putridiphycobacter roseus TaxID=2219161 RepID=A0A2W1NIJ5_9FLAO|nr:hypothetical protein [Putridiphycobacter roseus]PZE18863.1 hypothetical protein DNU06_03265 [Putridiphycobacter roseus]